jgi:hypothetical protein
VDEGEGPDAVRWVEWLHQHDWEFFLWCWLMVMIF